jgi:hypothetical protein
MSNCSGSYMLNDILYICRDKGIFEVVGKEKTKDLIKAIMDLGNKHDCNDYEILHGIGEEIGICHYCLEYRQVIESGLCKECAKELL